MQNPGGKATRTPPPRAKHLRAVEPKADFFLIQGGAALLRADPEYDMEIMGALKSAHLAEVCCVDVEPHACGPAHRHLISAPRNRFSIRYGEAPRAVYNWDFIKRHPVRLHEFR